MTATDFTLMAVLVIVNTFGLIRMADTEDIIARSICLLGGMAVTVFSMAIISTFVREEIKVDTLPHGSYAVQKLPNSIDYVVTEVGSGADKVLYKLDKVDTPATGLDQDLDLEVYKDDSILFRFFGPDTSYRGEYKVEGESQ